MQASPSFFIHILLKGFDRCKKMITFVKTQRGYLYGQFCPRTSASLINTVKKGQGFSRPQPGKSLTLFYSVYVYKITVHVYTKKCHGTYLSCICTYTTFCPWPITRDYKTTWYSTVNARFETSSGMTKTMDSDYYLLIKSLKNFRVL